MTANIAFATGLIVAMLLSCNSGSEGLRRAGVVMIASLFACWFIIVTTGSYGEWYLFAAINLASAFIVLREPAARTQAIIGALFLFQITVDVAFGLVGSMQAVVMYQYLQSMAGWVQIIALAVGGIYGSGKRVGGAWSLGHRHSSFIAAHKKDMEPPQ